MPWTGDDQLPRAHTRDELLRDVLRRGRTRRRRGQRLAACGVAVVAVLGAGLAAAASGGPGDRAQVAAGGGDQPSTVVTVTTTTTTPPAPVVPTTEARTTTTVAAITAPTAAPTTVPASTPPSTEPATTVPACWMSTDPACGPLRWEPDPGPNEPLQIDATPTVRTDGRTVDLAVTITDPDYAVQAGCVVVDWGDGATWSPLEGCAIASCLARFGAWPVPPRQEGRAPLAATHAYAAPGSYAITVRSDNTGAACGHPYASRGERTVTVVIPA